MSTDTLVMIFAIVVSLVAFGVLITLCVLVIRDTIRQRGRWGVNFSPPNCRHCDTPPPLVRIPANARQAMWGGWTCEECGLELDKWGEPIPDQTRQAKWAKPLIDPRNRGEVGRPADPRYKKPDDDVRPGGDFRD